MKAIRGAFGRLFTRAVHDCPCSTCDDIRRSKLGGVEALMRFMVLCPLCGNKRCPKAEWHGWRCTGSNEPDQERRPEEVIS